MKKSSAKLTHYESPNRFGHLIGHVELESPESKSSEFLMDWRTHPDSLTDKLKSISGEAKLQLLSQGWIRPSWWDAHVLTLQNEPMFQREIAMHSQGVACWYARSIIPEHCFNLDPVFFNRLENESIRHLIFNNHKVHRVSLHDYCVDYQCLEFYWVQKYFDRAFDTLWVRLAEYSFLSMASFYLVEILLPELGALS